MQIDLTCPNGHGDLVETWAGCHDDDPQCECETIYGCATCPHRHYETCVNARPEEIADVADGDTWSDGERLLIWDAGKQDWLAVPF